MVSLLVLGACNDDDSNMGQQPAAARFTVTIENVAPVKAYVASGVFNTPVGDAGAGPATPGKMYEFTFNAGSKQHLSFATMLAATNDAFFAPDGEGIALYDEEGNPLSGDITDQVYLWDAGTEVNEEPGVGPNTVSKQSAANTGVDENGDVLKMENVTNGEAYAYPAVADLIKVTLTHVEGTEFKVTLEDLATAKLVTSEGDKPAPMSPGVWVTTNGTNPLFTEGEPDYGKGLEHIAEDGNPTDLGAYIEANTGITYPASPGVYLVHAATNPFFTEGTQDYGDGLEAIAEDGNVTPLSTNLPNLQGAMAGGVFNMPEGSSTAGPLLPGSKYVFTVDGFAGENLSFVSMLAATNDVFFGTPASGIPLYDVNGNPLSGDITSQISLWDAGTEVNEQPGVGPNTVTNQLAANTGENEAEGVSLLADVNDGFSYPTVNSVLKITVAARPLQ